MNRFLSFVFAAMMIFLFVPSGNAGEMDGSIQASEVTASEESEKIRNMTGVLISIDSENQILTVKNRRWEKDFHFGDDTKVKEGRKFLTKEILEPGLNVKVVYQEVDGERAAQIVRIKK